MKKKEKEALERARLAEIKELRRQERVAVISSLIQKAYQASNLGCSFEIEDEEGRIEFAEWYLDVAEKLGLVVVPK